ncbi:ABC transporter substrate-binding protein [Insolitispirillum peregrinum]|uniref:ABC transporter substrate-binding protein n=1 Tax=Insolitispirillum peregrinum TaxID=80876 RepID=UPI0036146648
MKKGFFRKALLNTVLGTALAAVLGVAAGASAEAGTISLGHTTWVGYGPLYLARDLGYFKEQGLDLDLQVIEEASLYMAAAASGKLSGSASTIDEILKYRSPDFCFKAVVALDESYGGDGLVVSSDITSLAQLKGKTVALNEGSTSEFWLSYVLGQNGLSLKDIEISNMSADDAAAAFIAKRVPAAVTWEPNLTNVRKGNHGKVLADSSSTPGVIVDVVALGCEVIEKQPKDVAALVNGLAKANAFIKANPEKAYEIMAKGVGGYLKDPKDFAESAKGVRFYDADTNKVYLGTAAAPGPIAELIKSADATWSTLGKTRMKVDYAAMVDPTFVTAQP